MGGSSTDKTVDLKKFPLFANLPEEELKVASGLLRLKNFGRREIVCRHEHRHHRPVARISLPTASTLGRTR